MAIRIRTLTCNVTVALPLASSPIPGLVSEAPSIGRALPIARVFAMSPSAPPEAGDGATSMGANPAPVPGEPAPAGPMVDTRAVTERVYRLMLDDLRTARERE